MNDTNIEELITEGNAAIDLALNLLEGNFEKCVRMAELTAKLQRKAYDALLAEGFSEDQAVILCQNVGVKS